jgi:SNF2 family DNA or RNA helicase
MRFAERYGRIKTIIREKDNDGPRNRQSRGSSTSKTRSIEPGILPGLFGNHLLDKAVFLQLEQVAATLPKLEEELIAVHMEGAQAEAYEKLEEDMLAAVRDMARTGNKQLLGVMVNSLLYYQDTCYANWEPLGYYEGEREGEGAFITVHIPRKLSAETIYPKEQALLDLVRQEKQAGRQCWVYLQITEKHGLLDRLKAILERHGLKVGVLRASVELAKREEWIARNGKDVDVVLSHPKLVETGLDLFDKGGNHNFCTLIFYQTGYNLFTLRQASRRSWRIGQEKECKVIYLYYAGTMQERAMGLMGRKLAAAEAIDGKFSSDGLAAAAEDEGSLAMMLAKNLVDKLDDDPALAWAKTGAVQDVTELEQTMPRKKFPKRAAKSEAARPVVAQPATAEPAKILPFVKPEPRAESVACTSNLAARLAKIRLGRQLLAAK